MAKRRYKYLVADFETTVYSGQTDTQVWAAASVELGSEDVRIDGSIEQQWEYFKSLKADLIVYYHNLKFDGAFWLDYLINVLNIKQAYDWDGKNPETIVWRSKWDMEPNTVRYSLSDMGQWYSIVVKVGRKFIEFRDSLKLLPFSVKRIGQSFRTKHQKLDMEYEGLRYPGCDITPEEREYIANDVLVVKEALEIMFSEGHTKLTIGSCCLDEFKKSLKAETYDELFPNLYDFPLDESFGAENAGEYIRKSYRGGWCYLVKGKENKIKRGGTTADVNSLYPSMMSSDSGNVYPIHQPHFWKGPIPELAYANSHFFFVRIRTRFYIKEGKLPFIQLKHSFSYSATEMLTTSDIYDPKTGKHYRSYLDFDGEERPAIVEMTLTCTDWYLLNEHYNLVDLEVLDGCWFTTTLGVFDEYIEKYKQIKFLSKGAKRELAKLFLNNLYGKLASSTDSSFKVAYTKQDHSLGFITVSAHDKKPGYIAVGSAITSYARNFTIRAAQKNYHGVDSPGFIYADTDSIHCDLAPEDIKGIKVHDKDFCCWKLESCWDIGYFVRQKTYIEHVVKEDLEDCEPYYNLKCAGMPQSCKNLFVQSMEGGHTSSNPDEADFLSTKRTIEDFKIGLRIPGKLLSKRIPGGVLLVPTTFEMR